MLVSRPLPIKSATRISAPACAPGGPRQRKQIKSSQISVWLRLTEVCAVADNPQSGHGGPGRSWQAGCPHIVCGDGVREGRAWVAWRKPCWADGTQSVTGFRVVTPSEDGVPSQHVGGHIKPQRCLQPCGPGHVDLRRCSHLAVYLMEAGDPGKGDNLRSEESELSVQPGFIEST